MDKKITYFASLSFALTVTACGIAKPEYVPYETTNDQFTNKTGTSTGTSKTCEAGVAAFKANIAGAMATCASCHAAGNPLALKKDADAANRQALLDYSGGLTDKLFNFISDKSKHSGGDQSAALPKDKIAAWMAEEAKCK